MPGRRAVRPWWLGTGQETIEQHVKKISSLPFVDVLYIRCDWRNVQSRPGRLNLDPVWQLTLDAAKRKGLRVAFRIQPSNTSFQPEQLALPSSCGIAHRW